MVAYFISVLCRVQGKVMSGRILIEGTDNATLAFFIRHKALLTLVLVSLTRSVDPRGFKSADN